MGTHPIFESDFDCLTDMNNGLHAFIQNVITRIVITLLSAVANLIIPGSFISNCLDLFMSHKL